jgi:hypothetical protein
MTMERGSGGEALGRAYTTTSFRIWYDHIPQILPSISDHGAGYSEVPSDVTLSTQEYLVMSL